MMSISRFVFLLPLAFLTWGCIIIAGDSFFIVTGKIQTDMPIDSNRCTLGIFQKSGSTSRASVGDFVWARDVDPDFNETFTIAPKPAWYYLVIRCEDLGCYRTELLYLGTAETVLKPVDLGGIRRESFTPCEPAMRFGYYGLEKK